MMRNHQLTITEDQSQLTNEPVIEVGNEANAVIENNITEAGGNDEDTHDGSNDMDEVPNMGPDEVPPDHTGAENTVNTVDLNPHVEQELQ